MIDRGSQRYSRETNILPAKILNLPENDKLKMEGTTESTAIVKIGVLGMEVFNLKKCQDRYSAWQIYAERE